MLSEEKNRLAISMVSTGEETVGATSTERCPAKLGSALSTVAPVDPGRLFRGADHKARGQDEPVGIEGLVEAHEVLSLGVKIEVRQFESYRGGSGHGG